MRLSVTAMENGITKVSLSGRLDVQSALEIDDEFTKIAKANVDPAMPDVEPGRSVSLPPKCVSTAFVLPLTFHLLNRLTNIVSGLGVVPISARRSVPLALKHRAVPG
jgi:hypothetical protein